MNNDIGCERARIPLKNASHDLFPPLCIKSHWDPTAILNHILPSEQVKLPLDFRPLTRICKEYKTSSPEENIPQTPSNVVFPSGGKFYPPDRYLNAIDQESELRGENRPLNRLSMSKNYIVSKDSTMYKSNYTVPDRQRNNQIDELSIPSVLLRPNGYYCRKENDHKNFARSDLMFHNTTRQDRYKKALNLQPSRQNHYIPMTTDGFEAPV